VSPVVRGVLDVVALVAAGAVGGTVALWLVPRGAVAIVEDAGVVSGDGELGALERRHEDASRSLAALARALSAHTSLRARVAGVAESAGEHAQALTRLHEAGVAPRNVRANERWRPPAELSRDLPRPGPEPAWQALDRAFEALLATLDDPQASFADHAHAYQGVADAARAIADALAGASAVELAAGCAFCAKSRENVSRLIAGPGVSICDECVALCVEVMEEEVGPGWREEADRRLDGEEPQE
jgi:hypothetical protein